MSQFYLPSLVSVVTFLRPWRSVSPVTEVPYVLPLLRSYVSLPSVSVPGRILSFLVFIGDVQRSFDLFSLKPPWRVPKTVRPSHCKLYVTRHLSTLDLLLSHLSPPTVKIDGKLGLVGSKSFCLFFVIYYVVWRRHRTSLPEGKITPDLCCLCKTTGLCR